MFNLMIQYLICATFFYLFLVGSNNVHSQTLPTLVTIPPDGSNSSTSNSSSTSSSSSSTSFIALNSYDQACIDQQNSSDSNGTNSSDSSGPFSDLMSNWAQSQFVIFVGAVALNSENTCQVVCQKQSLQQFTIYFGQEIKTRSVLIGNIFMATMEDGASCDGGNGTCSDGECSSGGGGGNSTETSTGSSTTGGSTTAGGSSESTTSSSSSSNSTSSSSGSSNSTQSTTTSSSR